MSGMRVVISMSFDILPFLRLSFMRSLSDIIFSKKEQKQAGGATWIWQQFNTKQVVLMLHGKENIVHNKRKWIPHKHYSGYKICFLLLFYVHFLVLYKLCFLMGVENSFKKTYWYPLLLSVTQCSLNDYRCNEGAACGCDNSHEWLKR